MSEKVDDTDGEVKKECGEDEEWVEEEGEYIEVTWLSTFDISSTWDQQGHVPVHFRISPMAQRFSRYSYQVFLSI